MIFIFTLSFLGHNISKTTKSIFAKSSRKMVNELQYKS